jgi:hypothetical protein
MELFIPSLFVLLIAGLFSFLIIPRLSVPIVLFVSMIILVYVLRNHYSLFYNEYRYSTWQYTLKQYAPYVMILFLFIIIFTSSSFASFDGISEPPTSFSPLPPASTATNPITSALNTGMRSISNVASSVTGAITEAVNSNASKNSKSSSTYNLTSLFTSNKK